MKTLGAGVIGLGIGEQHLIGYLDAPGVEVRGICDIDPQKLQEVGARRGVATCHGDWRALVADPDIDMISICSYDDAHVEQAVAAFDAGKHCMIEKPVALSRTDAERLLRAQQDSGRLISSNLILRRSPRFLELRQRIAAGEFGDIAYVEGDYLHEILWKITEGWRGKMDFYCVTYGGGIHLIDLMRWVIGAEVTEVCGMGNKVFSAGSSYRYEDLIVNLLRFDSGAIGKTTTTLGPRRPKFHALNVYGTQRTFINDLPDAHEYESDDPEARRAVKTAYRSDMTKDALIADFVDAVRSGREPMVGARDVYRVMDICFACWEAASTGRTVQVSYQL